MVEFMLWTFWIPLVPWAFLTAPHWLVVLRPKKIPGDAFLGMTEKQAKERAKSWTEQDEKNRFDSEEAIWLLTKLILGGWILILFTAYLISQ